MPTTNPPRILVVDNYDSFVYNLYHYLAQVGAEVDVWRNDDDRFGTRDVAAIYDGILLSPGPGVPERAGVCVDLIRNQQGTVPILGVCLGMQAIAVAYGGTVARAPEMLHGKTSPVEHHGAGSLAQIPSPFTATRYHSLVVPPESVPAELEITARTETGVIMAMRHLELPVEGVQFHPESVLTEHGYQLLANWLSVCGDAAAPQRAKDLAPLMSAQ